MPADLRPEATDIGDELSAEYVERRCRWRAKGSPNPTLGDFIDLKTGLRNAVFNHKARGDLPFWLGILRQLLAIAGIPLHIQQRARYELVVATLRGTGDFQAVDDVARAYLDESLHEDEPIRLQDASTLLFYTNTAVRSGVSTITLEEIQLWNDGLADHIQNLIAQATLDKRAILLFALGHLGIQPAITDADIQASRDVPLDAVKSFLRSEPLDATNVSMSDDLALTDPARTLSAWTDLMQSLDETPLLPISKMSDIIQLLVPLWSNQPEWRDLLDLVDEAVAQRSGKNVVADRARFRAVKLLNAGRRLDALEEFHKVKIDWWSGETLRGSVLAMILIADLYFQMSLPQASKSYALAVSYIAYTSGDEELADLVPAGLLMAAKADFLAGAWCSATELYELGLATQSEFVEDGLDSEQHPEVQDAVLRLTFINSCARNVASDLTNMVGDSLDRIGARGIVEEVIDDLGTADKGFWESLGGLVARPFADVGETRYIRFYALGSEWTVIADNDIESVREAERFAAGCTGGTCCTCQRRPLFG